MEVKISSGIITRVFPSDKSPGRCYVNMIDISGGGGVFEFSSDNLPYAQLLSLVGRQADFVGTFEPFNYQNQTKFRCTKLEANPLQPVLSTVPAATPEAAPPSK